MNKLYTSAIFALLMFCAVATVSAQRGSWRELGTKEVDDRVDHDVLNVTRWKGDVRKIRISVADAPVRFYDVVVTYGNGRQQRLNVRSLVRRGGQTRAFDLPGRERVIQKIEFWYEAASLGRRKAKVTVWGQD